MRESAQPGLPAVHMAHGDRSNAPEKPWRRGRAGGRSQCREPAQRGLGCRIGEPLDIGRAPPIVPLGQAVAQLESAIEPKPSIERKPDTKAAVR